MSLPIEISPSVRQFVIIGGGPAGLTAGVELVKRGLKPHVLEQSETVGGLARTEIYRGFRFDMGGHRFFTKVPEIARFWLDLLGEDFLKRPRLSRIYFQKTFFRYPIQFLDTLKRLGPFESLAIVASYLWAQIRPRRPETSFESWVTNRFGRRLFKKFFESYTEKVWGISCTQLSAEWAAQRIKDLSVRTLLASLLTRSGRRVTSLIEEFHYPRLGPGMMWARAAERIAAGGGVVELCARVTAIHLEGGRVARVTVGDGPSRRDVSGTDFIASMPLSEVVACLEPRAPDVVTEAAAHLRYRDFLTVCVIVNRRDLFPDNWIYIHDPSVKVARIQNFKNWSESMSPDPERTSLGLEYFCNEGDALWTLPDADLLALARRELEAIGLAEPRDISDGCVFRVPKAYPVYDETYARHLAVVRQFIEGLTNLQMVGRNGLHRYNNQDHSMLTALYAVRNALGEPREDVWNVNTDSAFLENDAGEAREG